MPPLPPDLPAGYRVAGTAACRDLPSRRLRIYEHSKHAIAWRTLEERGLHVDPQCQTCHTTATDCPAGFSRSAQSPERTAVGCESCHGPSRATSTSLGPRTPFAARDQCLGCHDQENSPRFSFEPFWNKIRHGKAAPRPATSRERSNHEIA